MDWNLFIIIVGAGAILIGLAALMLHRAWGDFPGRLASSDPEASVRTLPRKGFQPDEDTQEASADQPGWPAGAPQDGLIPIIHPVVRRTVMQALERGGSPYASYFIRNGDQVYLASYRIADPEQRAQVIRIFHSLNSDELGELSIYDLLQGMARLGRV